MNNAIFSADRVYRYRLERHWSGEPPCTFVMLNPSTADETQNDPTIRRCIRFAQDWGYGSLIVVNIFGLRSTDPKALYKHPDPIGPENMTHIAEAIHNAAFTVCAWGSHGKVRNQGREVIRLLRQMNEPIYVLKTTEAGEPGHPLYVKASQKPVLL